MVRRELRIGRCGVNRLLNCLERNEAAGIVYHRSTTDLYGGYDSPDKTEDNIQLILTGIKQQKP